MKKKENQRITLTKRFLQEALLLMLLDKASRKYLFVIYVKRRVSTVQPSIITIHALPMF